MSRLKLRSEKRRPWNLRSPGVSRTGNPLHAVLVGTTKRCRIPPQNLDFNHPAPHAAAQCAAVEKHRLLACRSAALSNHTALKCPVYCTNSNVSSRLTDPPHISVPIVLRVFRSRQPISPDLTTLSRTPEAQSRASGVRAPSMYWGFSFLLDAAPRKPLAFGLPMHWLK